jgi:hypothetical protein
MIRVRIRVVAARRQLPVELLMLSWLEAARLGIMMCSRDRRWSPTVSLAAIAFAVSEYSEYMVAGIRG